MSTPAQKDLEDCISSSFCFRDTVTSARRAPNTPLKSCNSSFWAAENSIKQWYLERFILLLLTSERCPSCPALVIGLLLTLFQPQHLVYSSCVAHSMCKLCQNQAEVLVARTRNRRDLTVLSWAVAVPVRALQKGTLSHSCTD